MITHLLTGDCPRLVSVPGRRIQQNRVQDRQKPYGTQKFYILIFWHILYDFGSPLGAPQSLTSVFAVLVRSARRMKSRDVMVAIVIACNVRTVYSKQ